MESPVISLEMAIAEGWLTKNGSKWQTMPEVMLRYRAAAFFGKLYAPELLMGLQTAEEAHDIIEMEMPTQPEPKSIDKLKTPQPSSASAPTGEVTDVDDTSGKQDLTLAQQWAKYDQVLAEYGEKEAENFEPREPRPAANKAETKSQTEGGTSYALVLESINKASDLDVLHVAADLIKDVVGADLQKELREKYLARQEELQNPPADKPAAKRTPRNVGNLE